MLLTFASIWLDDSGSGPTIPEHQYPFSMYITILGIQDRTMTNADHDRSIVQPENPSQATSEPSKSVKKVNDKKAILAAIRTHDERSNKLTRLTRSCDDATSSLNYIDYICRRPSTAKSVQQHLFSSRCLC